jgi:hypothetical protein
MKIKITLVFLVLFLILSAGCAGLLGPKPVIVSQKSTTDFSFSKGIIYNIDVTIRNDGADGSIKVTAELIDKNKGFVRDRGSNSIYLKKGQTGTAQIILDGEIGRDYSYRVEVE